MFRGDEQIRTEPCELSIKDAKYVEWVQKISCIMSGQSSEPEYLKEN